MALDAPQRVFDVDAKKHSLLGLGIFLTDTIVCTINVTGSHEMVFAGIDVYSLTTVIFNWMMPLLILQKIERRGLDSIGLKVRSDRYLIYTALAFVGFCPPFFLFGVRYSTSPSTCICQSYDDVRDYLDCEHSAGLIPPLIEYSGLVGTSPSCVVVFILPKRGERCIIIGQDLCPKT